MDEKNNSIFLNDLLQLDNLNNVKIRLNVSYNDEFDPIELYKENSEELLGGLFWNYDKKLFKEGDLAIGLARINTNKWLLFYIGKIVKDLNIYRGPGYKYEPIKKYNKYFGRIIVKYHNKATQMIRNAEGLINELEVIEILPEEFNNEIFPGYENVNLSYPELRRVVEKKDWKTALENQKGVYLITDTNTGKLYVGSAYNKDMILGRWKDYIKNGHGGNKELKNIVKEKGFEYVKKYFYYSILDIYKSTTDDKIIISRESRWKEVLQTRKFGYNSN